MTTRPRHLLRLVAHAGAREAALREPDRGDGGAGAREETELTSVRPSPLAVTRRRGRAATVGHEGPRLPRPSPAASPASVRDTAPAPAVEASAVEAPVTRAKRSPSPEALPRGTAPVAGGKLFREAAVQAYLRGEAGARPLRVASTTTQALFSVAAFAAFVTLTVLAFARVDLTARGRGVLRAQGGAQTLVAGGAGRIKEVKVAPGDAVREGDVLATFDVASLRAALMEAETQVSLARVNLATFDATEATRRAEEARLLGERLNLLLRRIRSQGQTVQRMRRRAVRLRRLAAEGLVTVAEREEAEEQIAAAIRTVIALEDERMQTRTQLSRLASEVEAERRRLANEVASAEAHQGSVTFSLSQTTLVAGKSGRIDAVLVQPGENVAPSAPVARVVPLDAPLRVVSFLPERDRAFLEPGAEVRMELEQLPVGEFGALRGRVTRIGEELASTVEIQQALGDHADLASAVYRVEVEPIDDEQRQRLAPHLRSASLLSVRFSLRTRRVITLLFEPLQKVFS